MFVVFVAVLNRFAVVVFEPLTLGITMISFTRPKNKVVKREKNKKTKCKTKTSSRVEEQHTSPNPRHKKSKIGLIVTLPPVVISVDVWSHVVMFCNTPEWIQLSYTCKDLNRFKFCKELMKSKRRTMIKELSPDEITKYFTMCKGTLFNVHLRRNHLNIRDSHLSFLERIHALNICACVHLTDDAFKYLKGIHTLNMVHCSQYRITDEAFAHLKGVHTLSMIGCTQETITDKAFENLKGIHTLKMSKCRQETITDKAFEHLKGIHTLLMIRCDQETITDKAFANLKGIHTLNMVECTQETITDAIFEHLQGIESFNLICFRSIYSGGESEDDFISEEI